jgi:hypothetical protein
MTMRLTDLRFYLLVIGVPLILAVGAGLSIWRDHDATIARMHQLAQDMERIVED